VRLQSIIYPYSTLLFVTVAHGSCAGATAFGLHPQDVSETGLAASPTRYHGGDECNDAEAGDDVDEDDSDDDIQ
jgi:hypothetical protein